jgi:hypothetical protein
MGVPAALLAAINHLVIPLSIEEVTLASLAAASQYVAKWVPKEVGKFAGRSV